MHQDPDSRTAQAGAVVYPSDSSRTDSIWMNVSLPERAPLRQNLSTEVCVVGAGITGLSVAYHLVKAGKKVVVLDDGPLGAGETSRTTGHLASVIDDDFQNMLDWHGEDGARLAFQSHAAAIDSIEAIALEEGIDCDFARLEGFLILDEETEPEFLDRELEAAHRCGCTDARKLEAAPIPGFESGPCLAFPNQGRFHALKYLAGLTEAIERGGGQIYCGSHVTGIEAGKNGGPATVELEGGLKIECQHAIGAVNAPIAAQNLNFKQFPYRTYVVGGRVPRGSVPDMLLWDTADPYRYTRLQPWDEEHDFLYTGGQDHRTGEDYDVDERYSALEKWTRERFPGLGAIEFRWSGQVLEPSDGLAFIGAVEEGANVYVCTGDSGMGLTHGALAGLLLRGLIVDGQHPWQELYSPDRSGLSAPGELASGLLSTAPHALDYITGGDVASVDDLAPGQGAIVRQGLTKIAAFRDDDGTLSTCSAVCTHMKCIVSWNPEEKSFDCPCHGARFDTQGRVINGPAVKPLASIES